MPKRSKIVALTSLLPAVERQEVRNDFLRGRNAALRGETETRDLYAGRLGQYMNGIVAAVGFVAAALLTSSVARDEAPPELYS